METKLMKYRKDFDYSYALGFFPVFELVKHRPADVLKIVISTKAKTSAGAEKLLAVCSEKKIPASFDDKLITRISPKENCFAAGAFRKYKSELNRNAAHIVLSSPENAGNLGTIIRTMLGFDISDIAVISPGADIFDPACVRSSMGGIFQSSFSYFDSFEGYRKSFPKRSLYMFMTSGEKNSRETLFKSPYSLVFGSESSGLPEEFKRFGESVVIPQSGRIDSLNIAVAAGIAMYEAQKQFKI